MKDIKPFLPLYMGCDVCRDHVATRSDKFREHGKLVGVSRSEVESDKTVSIIDVGLDHFHEWYVEETKPILRKLDSMTERDASDIVGEVGNLIVSDCYTYLQDWINGRSIIIHFDTQVKLLNVMRKFRFDCDELIPEGLALDRSTLTH